MVEGPWTVLTSHGAEKRLTVKVFTIGFTKKSARDFFELLRESGAKRLVDVRLTNTSQFAGFAKNPDLAYFLENLCKVDYVHIPKLAPTLAILDAYKGQSGTWKAYESSFLELMRERRIETTIPKQVIADSCLLSSEHSPLRSHRRLVVEYLRTHWGPIDIVHLQ